MLKRTTFALGLLGISFSVFAGVPGNNMVAPTPSGVVLNAPDSNHGWSFGIEGMYVQPTGSEFQYNQVNDSTSSSNIFDNESVNNSYQWGGSADITYHFNGNSRDVTLGYTHLDSDDGDTSPYEAALVRAPIPGDSDDDDPNTSHGQVDKDYNAANLTFGQQFLLGNRLVLHPFGGVRYADINQNDKVVDTATTYSLTGKIDSDFQGAGPRAGIDVRVLTSSGLSVVGTIAGSLLVGNTDSHVNTSSSFASPTEWDNDEYTHVVPELDARVGLDYTPHKFFPNGSMGFQIGYEVVHYFNVSNLDAFDTEEVNSVNNVDSFGYQGPYLRLQLNVA